MSPPKSEPTASDVAERRRPPPTGFGRLSKRVSSWAGNLLVSAVIVVIALTFGREVMHWWYADKPSDADRHSGQDVVGAIHVGDQRWEHFLQFGDAPLTFGVSRVVGQKDAVFTALVASSRQVARDGKTLRRAPGPAEQKMLARTLQLKPVDAESGRWQIFQLDGPIPMVVAIGDNQPPPELVREVATPQRRVLSWGLALPGTNSEWTLFTCAAESGPATPLPQLPRLPVPPDSQRTLLLRTEGGGALVGLVGPGDIKAWEDYLDHWFADESWKVVSPWRRDGSNWQARYGDVELGWVHVQLSADNDFVRGMLTVAPPGGKLP